MNDISGYRKKLIFTKKVLLVLPCQEIPIAERLRNDVSIEMSFAKNVAHARGQLDLHGLQVANLEVADLCVEADGQEVVEQRSVDVDLTIPIGLEVDFADGHGNEEDGFQIVAVHVLGMEEECGERMITTEQG